MKMWYDKIASQQIEYQKYRDSTLRISHLYFYQLQITTRNDLQKYYI